MFLCSNPSDYGNGTWMGNCSDPKLLLEKLKAQLNETMLGTFEIRLNSILFHHSSIKMDSSFSVSEGPCYHLDIFQQDTYLVDIASYNTITVFVHSPRIWKKHGYMLSYRLNRGERRIVYVDLEALHVLDYLGEPCYKDDSNNYDDCITKEIDQSILMEFGCTSPFGLNLDDICKDSEKKNERLISKMMEFENVKYPPNNCTHPCSYLKIKSITSIFSTGDPRGHLTLNFQSAVTVTKSEYSYNMLSMIAEIGGYVGLFLGYSVLQISCLLDKAMLLMTKY